MNEVNALSDLLYFLARPSLMPLMPIGFSSISVEVAVNVTPTKFYCFKSEVKRFGETRLSKPLHFAFIAFFRSPGNSSLSSMFVGDRCALGLIPL